MIYLGSKIKPATVCFIVTIHMIIDHRTMTIFYRAKSIVKSINISKSVCVPYAYTLALLCTDNQAFTKHLDTTTSCSNAWLSVHDIVFR